MYYVYVLYNQVLNKFYTGFSNDIKKRIKEHRLGKTYAGSNFKNFTLVYCEICLSKKDALIREKQLKTGFGRGYLKRRLKNYLKGA